jgi:hypothetical protein
MNEIFEVDGIRYSYARLGLILYGLRDFGGSADFSTISKLGKGG